MPASSFTPYDPVPLVLAAQRGNQAAFDALISLYQYRILRQCRGFFLQGAEFEDVLQEGRIGFFHAVRSFSVHRSIPFDSYVSICVKRQLADAVRMFSRSTGPSTPMFLLIVRRNPKANALPLNLVVSHPNHSIPRKLWPPKRLYDSSEPPLRRSFHRLSSRYCSSIWKETPIRRLLYRSTSR